MSDPKTMNIRPGLSRCLGDEFFDVRLYARDGQAPNALVGVEA